MKRDWPFALALALAGFLLGVVMTAAPLALNYVRLDYDRRYWKTSSQLWESLAGTCGAGLDFCTQRCSAVLSATPEEEKR